MSWHDDVQSLGIVRLSQMAGTAAVNLDKLGPARLALEDMLDYGISSCPSGHVVLEVGQRKVLFGASTGGWLSKVLTCGPSMERWRRPPAVS